MNLLSLVFVNLGRNKRRTILTLLSVTVALFLFCTLGGVLDTLQESIKFGSETRLVTRNAISLIFPLPLAYRDRIGSGPGSAALGTATGSRSMTRATSTRSSQGDLLYLSIYAATTSTSSSS